MIGDEFEWYKDDQGRQAFREVEGTEKEWPCQLVLLAMGFLGPEKRGAIAELGLALDPRGNVKCDAEYMSSVEGVFAAGDLRRGQSLVVWAIHEGREAARAVDKYLMGVSYLPSVNAGDFACALKSGIQPSTRLEPGKDRVANLAIARRILMDTVVLPIRLRFRRGHSPCRVPSGSCAGNRGSRAWARYRCPLRHGRRIAPASVRRAGADCGGTASASGRWRNSSRRRPVSQPVERAASRQFVFRFRRPEYLRPMIRNGSASPRSWPRIVSSVAEKTSLGPRKIVAKSGGFARVDVAVIAGKVELRLAPSPSA